MSKLAKSGKCTRIVVTTHYHRKTESRLPSLNQIQNEKQFHVRTTAKIGHWKNVLKKRIAMSKTCACINSNKNTSLTGKNESFTLHPLQRTSIESVPWHGQKITKTSAIKYRNERCQPGAHAVPAALTDWSEKPVLTRFELHSSLQPSKTFSSIIFDQSSRLNLGPHRSWKGSQRPIGTRTKATDVSCPVPVLAVRARFPPWVFHDHANKSCRCQHAFFELLCPLCTCSLDQLCAFVLWLASRTFCMTEKNLLWNLCKYRNASKSRLSPFPKIDPFFVGCHILKWLQDVPWVARFSKTSLPGKGLSLKFSPSVMPFHKMKKKSYLSLIWKWWKREMTARLPVTVSSVQTWFYM